MNIVTRTINNYRYAYYRILREKAMKKMIEHEKDSDPEEWLRWANISLNALQKCCEIQIH